jgi:hypothetical protein
MDRHGATNKRKILLGFTYTYIKLNLARTLKMNKAQREEKERGKATPEFGEC